MVKLSLVFAGLRCGVPVAFASVFLFSASVFAQSTIEGTVYDRNRNPLPDIEVEIQDDLGRGLLRGGRSRTDATGRYRFTGLADGRYTLRVFAFRYDFEDQTQMVEVQTQNIRGGPGVGFFLQDFVLSPRRGGLAESELAVVFAQEVPDQARRAYERAVGDLRSGRTADGISGLNEALKIFPDYYLALARMGRELFAAQRFEEAVPFLLHAARINPRTATSLYYLGMSLYALGPSYDAASIASLENAARLAPASPQVFFGLGRSQRRSGRFKEAEASLLRAKSLSKEPVPEIHAELAQLYGNDLKRFREAAAELELYLKASGIKGEEARTIQAKIAEMREKGRTAQRDQSHQ